jgi:cell division transport system permease protein
MIQTLLRIIGYGVQGFRRNIWLSIIAIVTMTMTLLTITSLTVGDQVIATQVREFSEKNIDYAIFLKDTASDVDIAQLQSDIRAQSEVLSINFIDKDEARRQFEALFGDDPNLKGVITDENNPLPREITVTFTSPKAIEGFNSFVKNEKYQEVIEELTSYDRNKDSIDTFIASANFIKIVGLSVTVFFIFIAILVLFNTIRLTIFSRRTEVEVMRFVGATQGYIRGPFMVEGVLFGLISAVCAALFSWLILNQMELLVAQNLAAGRVSDMTRYLSEILLVDGASNVSAVVGRLFGLQLVAGLLFGVLCSALAVRRYLKE